MTNWTKPRVDSTLDKTDWKKAWETLSDNFALTLRLHWYSFLLTIFIKALQERLKNYKTNQKKSKYTDQIKTPSMFWHCHWHYSHFSSDWVCGCGRKYHHTCQQSTVVWRQWARRESQVRLVSIFVFINDIFWPEGIASWIATLLKLLSAILWSMSHLLPTSEQGVNSLIRDTCGFIIIHRYSAAKPNHIPMYGNLINATSCEL